MRSSFLRRRITGWGNIAAVIRYDAVLSWERFPYRLCPPRSCLCPYWLRLDDADRELLDEVGLSEAEPDWDVSVDDEEVATVVLTVPMVEELVIRQDENGLFRGVSAGHWLSLKSGRH